MRFNFDFIGRRRQFYVLSVVILVVAIGGFFLRGLNLGIDFSGGIQMQVHFQKPVQLTTVDATLRKDGISNYFAVYLGSGKQNIQISMPAVSETLRATVDQSLTKDVGPYTITSFTKVTGSFSSQVVRGGVIAVLLASLGIILYMMIRFDLRFAISGIFAVFWDAFVSLGLVALIHFTVNAPFVAGVLTIIGYSINDRIIIFDRVRENLKKRGKESLAEIVNLSLNQTLGRSIATATVVVIAMLAILILGGATTQDLAATVVIGVVFGAYSSILLASPIWYEWVFRVEAQAAATAVRVGRAPAPKRQQAVADPEAEQAVRRQSGANRPRGRKKRRRR
ncbi:MAG: protein translocase subunit SecF [Sulfobacillus sp.]